MIPSKRLQGLHPVMADLALRLVESARLRGIELIVTSGFRSFEAQAALYAQGRTKPGRIVTNAKPGQSLHNFGIAYDVCPVVNGKPDWESPHWNTIGELGERLGLTWGGRWKFRDLAHFQLTLGLTLAELNRRHHARCDVLTGKALALDA